MKKKNAFKWGSLIALMCLLLLSFASFTTYTPALGAEKPVMGKELLGQLPTPVLNPNKVTPTPGGALPTIAPVQPTSTPVATQPPINNQKPTPTAASSEPACIPVNYGQTVQGEINTTAWYVTYCFEALAGDVVSIDMVTTSGTLDGYLGILDSAAAVVVENDDRASGDTNPLISSATIATAGVYTIVATRYDLEAGTTTGTFSLTVEAGAPPPVTGGGFEVTCDTGANITNGVEVVVVEMRPGFSYTATAVGLNGFDPVLAALDSNGNGLCNDDDSTAAVYNANLPSTGGIPSAGTSARVTFSQNAGDFENVSLVVGGYNGQGGEFLLILEGMAVTSADGAGDPFAVIMTPNLINSGVPATVYMISNVNGLDPYITSSDLVDLDTNNAITCDDAGNADLCWGESGSLANSFITIQGGRQLPGFAGDAMLQIPLENLNVEQMTFLMGSYNQQTNGDYTVIFHLGITQ